MTLLDSWMPTFDVAARYGVRIAAPPEQVYRALLETDFSRPWVVRGLMGLRLLPGLFRAPRLTWRRLFRDPDCTRASLTRLEGSDFLLLEALPPREIVLGITGRFWTLAATVVPIPPAQFREPLPAGLAQAAWNFEVHPSGTDSELFTETRIRCADAVTRRQFRRYWRLVAPGSGLIRWAILSQVRRESLAAAG